MDKMKIQENLVRDKKNDKLIGNVDRDLDLSYATLSKVTIVEYHFFESLNLQYCTPFQI